MLSTARALVAGAALLLILPAGVLAHAKLVSSIPAADAVVTVLPAAIVVTFDDPLVASSSVEVVDAAGSTIAVGGVDPSDPLTMRVGTPDLPNGAYEIRWTARTADDNVERGTIPFRVAIVTPAPITPAPTILATQPASVPPTVAPSGEPTAAPSAAGGPADSDDGGGDALIPIGAAAVLVGIGLVWFLRRRPA